MLVSHDELAQKVATLERRYDGQRDPDLKEVRASVTQNAWGVRRTRKGRRHP